MHTAFDGVCSERWHSCQFHVLFGTVPLIFRSGVVHAGLSNQTWAFQCISNDVFLNGFLSLLWFCLLRDRCFWKMPRSKYSYLFLSNVTSREEVGRANTGFWRAIRSQSNSWNLKNGSPNWRVWRFCLDVFIIGCPNRFIMIYALLYGCILSKSFGPK